MNSLTCGPSSAQKSPLRVLALVAFVMDLGTTAAAPLTLAEVEALALESDPGLRRLEAEAGSLAERSIAVGQLPDPKLKLGAAALPLNSFDLNQEPMTQLQLGVQQHFPPGHSRRFEARSLDARAAASATRMEDRRLHSLLSVRQAFLEVFYHQQADRILAATREDFTELVMLTEDLYASGRTGQADVYQAQLELSRLEDRMVRNRQAELEFRARLSWWIGDQADRPVAGQWPELQPVPELAPDDLTRHPKLLALAGEIRGRELGVDAARERRKPGWTLDVTYGDRSGQNLDGSARADFLTAMVSFDLPLFPDQRQDREVAARLHAVDEATAAFEEMSREIRAMAQREKAALVQTLERQKLYTGRLLPEASASAEAAMDAYRTGTGSLTDLVKARLTEHEITLGWMRARIDALLAHVRLRYLAGEQP